MEYSIIKKNQFLLNFSESKKRWLMEVFLIREYFYRFSLTIRVYLYDLVANSKYHQSMTTSLKFCGKVHQMGPKYVSVM